MKDTASDSGQDDALAFAGDESTPIDPVVEKRVRRKIDLFFIPAMTIGCMSQSFQPYHDQS